MIFEPKFIKANWQVPDRVKTIVTSRHGGCSINEYTGFNLAKHVDDDFTHVNYNRELLNKYLPDTPIWLKQTHSSNVLNLGLNFNKSLLSDTKCDSLEYDASFSHLTHRVCTILTADCLPILVTDNKASFVAAIHAGWRGVANKIIENTLVKSTSDFSSVIAYIGPAICQKHFEVGLDVYKIFLDINKDYASCFDKQVAEKYTCDLNNLASLQLQQLGVLKQNIYLSNLCTYCNSDLFYSYRKNNITGRQASLIWLEK